MKRENLVKNKEFWLVQIQDNLFGAIENYLQKTGFNRTKPGEKLCMTKVYIKQTLPEIVIIAASARKSLP